MSRSLLEQLADQPPPEYVVVADVKAANTPGGTFTSGAWRTRDLNTLLVNPQGLASVAANQFTLAPGDWTIFVSAPANSVGRNQLRLLNVTTGDTEIATSMSGNAATALNTFTVWLVARAAFVVPTTFRVEHQGVVTANTIGFGGAANLGVNEMYTVVEAVRTRIA